VLRRSEGGGEGKHPRKGHSWASRCTHLIRGKGKAAVIQNADIQDFHTPNETMNDSNSTMQRLKTPGKKRLKEISLKRKACRTAQNAEFKLGIEIQKIGRERDLKAKAKGRDITGIEVKEGSLKRCRQKDRNRFEKIILGCEENHLPWINR